MITNRITAEVLGSHIEELVRSATDLEQLLQPKIREVRASHRKSATNLAHYLALRKYDIRELQENLSEFGVSSLGGAEVAVMKSLHNLSKILYFFAKKSAYFNTPQPTDLSFKTGKKILKRNTDRLLGISPENRTVRILVTLPSMAAENYGFVKNLLEKGTNAVRINCAHDSPEIWAKMIENVQLAEMETGKKCRILADLAGPKIRTGAMAKGAEMMHWSPKKNQVGDIIRPARILLAANPENYPEQIAQSDAFLPLSESFLNTILEGDTLHFQDRRMKDRKIKIIKKTVHGFWGECHAAAFVESDTKLTLVRENKHEINTERVGKLPALENYLILRPNDPLILTRKPIFGKSAIYDKDGNLKSPAQISCTFEQIFEDAKAGETIKFDDGKIEGIIEQILDDQMKIRITMAKENGTKLKAEKGINFPDTHLTINGLTPKDLKDLDFMAKHADIISMSFVNTPQDVLNLQSELRKRKATQKSIVLKIETLTSFNNLPDLLLTAMRSESVGVMIARGDLAVECGWVRMAEIQEEILWFCEAAHIPVIWATQVLENLAKKGLPSRAEITDAAVSQRAECVMLNKGDFIPKAIETLDNILTIMQMHQTKKKARLRRLSISENLQFADTTPQDKPQKGK